MCATHQPHAPLRCRYANVKKISEVTVQHALAELRNRTQVGTDRREGCMVVHQHACESRQDVMNAQKVMKPVTVLDIREDASNQALEVHADTYRAPTLVAVSQFLFNNCTSTPSVNVRSAHRRKTALLSGSTNPCHKARHHVTTLTFSIQNCAGNVTGPLALSRRFFHDLAKSRVGQLLRDTCNHIVIAEENKCLRESHHRLQQSLSRRRPLAQLQRPMPSPSHHELPVPPTKDKNRQKDTEDTITMGCCAHAEFSNMSTLLRAFLCTDVGTLQILHSNMLRVVGRAELNATPDVFYTRSGGVEFSVQLNLCEVRKHVWNQQDCGSGMRFRVSVGMPPPHTRGE